MRLLPRSLAMAMLCAAATAQARNERSTTVGMRAYVEQVMLPGSELITAPTDTKAPVIVRIVEIWPHGDSFRYDLEWVGYEPGRYDLVQFLARKDGSEVGVVPQIEVEVTSTLLPDAFEPSELDPEAAQRLDGYSKLQVVVGVLWIIGLLSILFVGRKWRRKAEPAPSRPTLADRLRPLVEEVAAGRADDAQKAELERLLVAFWRARLDLGDKKAAEAIVTIRRHPEAGALLRQVEGWLHMPQPPAAVDLQELLAPYRAVTADSFAPVANGSAGGPGSSTEVH